MNTSIIRYILGQVLKVEGILMLLPCLVALIYKESSGAYFVITVCLCLLVGTLLTLRKPKNHIFYLKEGCLTTALSWIVLSIFGALPFYISGEIPSYTDALFETISGFTTTGSSILTDVEALSHCMLFWRSFTHWIGGMGVLVFVLAIIPLSGGSNINILRAESPGPSVGKLVPKMRGTARILYGIYIFLTLLQIILLLVGKMPLFDALCTAFGTAGTGGFGTLNSSMGSFSPYIQWVVTIFMILFGINFNAYYFILLKQVGKAFRMEEVRVYLAIILTSIAFITTQIVHLCNNVFEAITHASFQVGSIITTTGFSSTDFGLWPISCKIILVILMFVGACAGSTGGGIKISRFVILAKAIRKEIRRYIHPHSVHIIQMDKKPLEHEVVRSVNIYMSLYAIIFVASVFLVSLNGYDLVTTFTSVAATLNNIGPGLELVGPTGNFAFFNAFSKYVLMFDMLAGRLELFPLIIMCHPTVWVDFFKKHK